MRSSPQIASASYKSAKFTDLEAGKLFLMPPVRWSYAFFVKRRIIEAWQGWETTEDYGLVQIHERTHPNDKDEQDLFLVLEACCLIRNVQGLHVVGLWRNKLIAIPRDRVDTYLYHIEEKAAVG